MLPITFLALGGCCRLSDGAYHCHNDCYVFLAGLNRSRHLGFMVGQTRRVGAGSERRVYYAVEEECAVDTEDVCPELRGESDEECGGGHQRDGSGSVDLGALVRVGVGAQLPPAAVPGASVELEGVTDVGEGEPQLGLECNWKPTAKGLGEHRREVTSDSGTLDEALGQSFAPSLPALKGGGIWRGHGSTL